METPLAFTVPEFCKAFKLSRGRYHELTQAGLGPRTYRIASKEYVAQKAALEWQQRMIQGEAEGFKPLPAKHPGRPGRVKVAAT